MSVEDVNAIFNVKTLKVIDYTQSSSHTSSKLGGGVMKSVEKKKSVPGQFAVKYRPETYCWTEKVKSLL
jgi:hypothetical protein